MSENTGKRKNSLVYCSMANFVARSAASTPKDNHTSALRACRSSGRAPHARSPELAFDFIKRFHAAFANRRVVRVLTHMRRIIPAALAFRAVRATHCDTQARKQLGFLPILGRRISKFDPRHDEQRREPALVLFKQRGEVTPRTQQNL